MRMVKLDMASKEGRPYEANDVRVRFMLDSLLCVIIIRTRIGTGGIEPPASSVSRKRSPTELRAFTKSRFEVPKYNKSRSKKQNEPDAGVCDIEIGRIPAASRNPTV